MIIWKGLNRMTDIKGEQNRTEDIGTVEGPNGKGLETKKGFRVPVQL